MTFNEQLAVGVHPLDQRGVDPTIGETPPHQLVQEEKPFGIINAKAFAVYERSGADWNVQTYIVSGSVQIAPRQRGRKSATLYVASGAANGVQFAPMRELVDAEQGGVLAVGASVDIFSEGSIWVAPLVGQANGSVTILTYFNPQIDI